MRIGEDSGLHGLRKVHLSELGERRRPRPELGGRKAKEDPEPIEKCVQLGGGAIVWAAADDRLGAFLRFATSELGARPATFAEFRQLHLAHAAER